MTNDSLNSQANKDHKKRGLYVLTFGEFWDRFSFFGTLTILVLYLTKVFLFSDSKSYSLYGVYITFSFALPVIGGFLADRFIGQRAAVTFGAILMIAGNLLLIIPQLHFFYIGLAFTLGGTGLYKVSCTSMVGNLYDHDDPRREGGFTFFYAVMNIGAVAGPIVYGVVAYTLGWRYGFLISAVGIFVGLMIFLANSQYFSLRHHIASSLNSKIFVYLLMFACCFLISFPFFHPYGFGAFLAIFALVIFATIIIMATKYNTTECNRIFALLILIFFCVFFFAASLQVGSSLTLFVNRNINRVLLGWKLPTMLFSSLDPLFVVLTAPIFAITWKYLAQKNKEPAVGIKLFLGLLLGSIGFICFIFAAHNSHLKYYSWLWLVFGYLFLGAGEICLTPAILSAVSRFAPDNLKATMIGIFFLAVAFAGYLSSIIAKISIHAKVSSIQAYSHTFIIVAIITAAIGFILLALTPWIKLILAE